MILQLSLILTCLTSFRGLIASIVRTVIIFNTGRINDITWEGVDEAVACTVVTGGITYRHLFTLSSSLVLIYSKRGPIHSTP